MRKFIVHLSREYVVEINAENEEKAREFTELYVSGGEDDSREITRLTDNFQIDKIKPIINDAMILEEI
jgi:hypothetical protein